jgi:tartrate-resistant acid phosphatase type 5
MTIKSIIYSTLLLILFASCSEKDNNSIYQNSDTSFVSKIIVDTSFIDFFVISDWGENANEYQTSVAEAMGNLSATILPDFVITCGDNFELDGVQSIDDIKWQRDFENEYNYPGLNVKWYAALGNHDYLGNPEAELTYTKHSNKWCMPSRYYTFVYELSPQGSIRFIVLDTQGLINKYDSLPETDSINSIDQVHWLDSVLSKSKEDWIIVVGHHTIYSSSYYHGNTSEMIKAINPVLEKYKVDYYISGHDHDFEYIHLPYKKPDYIITGTGSSIRAIVPTTHTIFCISKLGFSYIRISKSCFTLQFIDCQDSCVYKTIFKK